MSTIDGNEIEHILWSEGYDFSLSTDKETGNTVLKMDGTSVDIGLVWLDDESESGWSFEIGDIYLYLNSEFYTSLYAETAESLVSEVLRTLEKLGVDSF